VRSQSAAGPDVRLPGIPECFTGNETLPPASCNGGFFTPYGKVQRHRVPRSANALRKMFENFQAAVALNFAYPNFGKT
jgi:hypothetical protein